MKKILFIIVILFSISIISFPQKTKPKYSEIKKVGNLKKVRLNNLWGVLNQEDKIIIPIQFRDIQLSECGLIAAKLTHNFAVFNTTGEQLSEFSYPKIHQMEDSVAKVEKDGKIGYINYWGSKTGEIYEYQSGYFVNGFVRVKKRDKNGFTTKIGYLNKYLKQITEIKYSSESSDFYCSRAKICVAKEVKEQDYMYGYTITKYGFINEDGEEIIKPIWDDAKDFSDGIAQVNVGYVSIGNSGKWGLVDSTGQEITSIKYDWIGVPINGLIKVSINNLYGYIDIKGKEIFEPKFQSASDFKNGFATVLLNGKKYLLTIKGEIISENK